MLNDIRIVKCQYWVPQAAEPTRVDYENTSLSNNIAHTMKCYYTKRHWIPGGPHKIPHNTRPIHVLFQNVYIFFKRRNMQSFCSFYLQGSSLSVRQRNYDIATRWRVCYTCTKKKPCTLILSIYFVNVCRWYGPSTVKFNTANIKTRHWSRFWATNSQPNNLFPMILRNFISQPDFWASKTFPDQISIYIPCLPHRFRLNGCWPSPEQSFLLPGPLTIFFSLTYLIGHLQGHLGITS
jgi:hypothetical protein